MTIQFESLIERFLADNVGVVSDFLDRDLAAPLREHVLALNLDSKLHNAGVGDTDHVVRDSKIRGDMIYWLGREHDNPHENLFLDLIDRFVSHLNRTCYTRITGHEFHYAVYPAGTFYKRHVDRFKHNSNRIYSMIFYLNPDWKNGDGGQLWIHHLNRTQLVTPENRKCVFFESKSLEHEVQISHQPRVSITGWLKCD